MYDITVRSLSGYTRELIHLELLTPEDTVHYRSLSSDATF